MPEVESNARPAAAYRADASTQAHVPESQVRSAAQRRARIVAGVAAAAFVLAIVATGFVARAWSNHHSNAAGRSASFYRGSTYKLTSVEHAGRSMSAPASMNASVAFNSEGTIGINDSLNYTSGPFRVVAGGFTTGELTGTAVGYDGRDPVRLTVISGLDAIYVGSDAAPSTRVAVSGDRTYLTLTAGGYTLRLHRTGAATDSGEAPETDAGPADSRHAPSGDPNAGTSSAASITGSETPAPPSEASSSAARHASPSRARGTRFTAPTTN